LRKLFKEGNKMSFYIRKSLRAGPFRFNISKSGIGVSAGITGFRVGTGPRGNYIRIGRNGFYYRKTIPSDSRTRGRRPTSTRQPIPLDTSGVQMEEVESGEVLEMQDSSSAALLSEINARYKKPKTWPIVAVLCCFALLVLPLFPIFMGKIPQLESFSVIFACLAFPLLAFFSGTIIFLAYRQDQVLKTVVMFYELDDEAERTYQGLHDTFKALASCSRVWHIEAQGEVRDLQIWKREAGATTLVRRKPIQLTCKAPPYISANVSVPAIPVGRQSLYFFPDRLLVYEKGKVGAVSYADVQVQVSNTRFIEDQGVPKDTKVVDYTWQYVNKKGGPDRRFKNNRRLPVALYTELYFTSQTGLNELIQASRPDTGLELADAFRKLALLQANA
jgi:hypothetical protein